MTDNASTNLIRRIHDTSAKACLVITGAGTSAISALFGVAGSSRTVIEAQIPYSMAALDNYVGMTADQHVSREEARIMAIRAYERAVSLSETAPRTQHLVGLSCTAAIATDRERRGENRAHIAWHDGNRGASYSIVMNKGARDRAGEETVCKVVILNALAEACGTQDRLQVELLEGENVERVAH